MRPDFDAATIRYLNLLHWRGWALPEGNEDMLSIEVVRELAENNECNIPDFARKSGEAFEDLLRLLAAFEWLASVDGKLSHSLYGWESTVVSGGESVGDRYFKTSVEAIEALRAKVEMK